MPLIQVLNNLPKAANEPFSHTDGVVSVEFKKDNLPVRKVVSRSNTRATGKWPSWKLEKMVHYDSPHECNAFKLLDTKSDVLSYLAQPCTIHYVLDKQMYRHVPDILVNLQRGVELWEVKTAADAARPEVERRTELMMQCLPNFGYQYRVVIAEEMQKGPQLLNANILLKHGRQPVTVIEYEQIRQLFSRMGSISWGYFQHGEAGAPYLKQVCRLLLEGELTIDLKNKLEITTEVYLSRPRFGVKTWE